MTDPIQADWLLATLEDARDALDTAIDSLSRHPEEAEEILTEETVPENYRDYFRKVTEFIIQCGEHLSMRGGRP